MELTELLGQGIALDSLSDGDLVNYRQDLAAAARAARGGPLTAEVAGLIKAAAGQVAAAWAEETARVENAALVEADVDAALLEIEHTPVEPIAASDRGAGRAVVKDVRVPARSRPRSTARGAGGPVIVASGAGAERVYRDHDELVAALNEVGGHTAAGQTVKVAEMRWADQYASEAVVTDMAGRDSNTALLARVGEEHRERMRDQNRERAALVASGGVPGPGEARYDLTTYGVADRPARGALPGVLLKRGTINYNASPTMEDLIVDTTNGAIGTITNAQDVSGATKTVQDVPAPTPLSATVEANYMRFQQSNFADRFGPELTSAYLKLGLVRYARHNDARLFAQIKAASTRHFTDTPAKAGALRDLKRAVLGITEELEDKFRDPDLPIRILAPSYLPAMLAADLIAQAPGDGTWAVTEDAVRSNLESMDANVTWSWVLDGTQTNQRLLTTPAGQSPRAPAWDNDPDLLIFPEGAWAFGDGGALDLGILRDTVVSQNNRFQTFFESWEIGIPIVPVSYCATLSLCANGASQAASSISGMCDPGGS